MYKSTIVVRTNKEMIHKYTDAPGEVEFLREYHRHVLHIETEIEVFHDDRELEFFMVKRYIDDFLEHFTDLLYVEKSCEMLAKEIIESIVSRYGEREITCSVFEDGENGGRVSYTPKGE